VVADELAVIPLAVAVDIDERGAGVESGKQVLGAERRQPFATRQLGQGGAQLPFEFLLLLGQLGETLLTGAGILARLDGQTILVPAHFDELLPTGLGFGGGIGARSLMA